MFCLRSTNPLANGEQSDRAKHLLDGAVSGGIAAIAVALYDHCCGTFALPLELSSDEHSQVFRSVFRSQTMTVAHGLATRARVVPV